MVTDMKKYDRNSQNDLPFSGPRCHQSQCLWHDRPFHRCLPITQRISKKKNSECLLFHVHSLQLQDSEDIWSSFWLVRHVYFLTSVKHKLKHSAGLRPNDSASRRPRHLLQALVTFENNKNRYMRGKKESIEITAYSLFPEKNRCSFRLALLHLRQCILCFVWHLKKASSIEPLHLPK